VAWWPACKTPFLRLIKCVAPRLRAWAFALRRQRSHVRTVSGAPSFLYFYSAICATGRKLLLCLVGVSKQI
jgi:hypothetical protein